MAKGTMTAERFDAIQREAQEVEQLTKMPGWDVIAGDIREQMAQIANLLAENRLRTTRQTVVTKSGSKTTVTTAETQIAENAGMYKAYRRILNLVSSITTAPQKLMELEQQGKLVIEKRPDVKKEEVK